MKYNLLIVPLCALFTIAAFANDMPPPPNGERGPRGGGMPMMQNLTEEQKTCMQNAMAQCGIEMPTPPEKPANGQSVQPRQ